jgi:hypothetical protein
MDGVALGVSDRMGLYYRRLSDLDDSNGTSQTFGGNRADPDDIDVELQPVALPLPRPMPSISASTHELRFRDRSGIYRVIYYIRRRQEI